MSANDSKRKNSRIKQSYQQVSTKKLLIIEECENVAKRSTVYIRNDHCLQHGHQQRYKGSLNLSKKKESIYNNSKSHFNIIKSEQNSNRAKTDEKQNIRIESLSHRNAYVSSEIEFCKKSIIDFRKKIAQVSAMRARYQEEEKGSPIKTKIEMSKRFPIIINSFNEMVKPKKKLKIQTNLYSYLKRKTVKYNSIPRLFPVSFPFKKIKRVNTSLYQKEEQFKFTPWDISAPDYTSIDA